MEKKKSKGKIILAVVLILLLLLAAGACGYLLHLRSLGTFIDRTSLNGLDVSEMSVGEVTDMLIREFGQKTFRLTEKGEIDLECSLDELGIRLDETNAQVMVKRALDMQNKSLLTLAESVLQGKSFRVEIPFLTDEEVFQSKMNVWNFAVPRVETEDAKLIQTEDRYFDIIPEVYGNVFDEAQLQERMKEEIGQMLFGGNGNGGAFASDVFEVAFPEELYVQPQILSTDNDLLIRKEAYNRYCRAEIVYEFGSETQTLGWDTVKDWIVFEGSESSLDSDKIWAYIEEMAFNYNTRYYDRTFYTTMSGEITIPGSSNEYGYTINQDAEYERIREDLFSGETVRREPIYFECSDYGNPYYYSREGKDDLAGAYVEISLTLQHLWFYKEGSLIFETDVVTGFPSPDRETITGVFPLAYKKSPDILIGENDSYRTEVQYWMPFYEGQGLHDATWQSSFGGSTYLVSGSHGCVNLSLGAAAFIYENIEPGMAIVLYK